MEPMIFTAARGANHAELQLREVANNIANANTTGFKADFLSIVNKVNEDGSRSGLSNQIETGYNFKPGGINSTGNALDVAIKGEGWFAVEMPDGSEAYTRAGNFQINAVGELVTPRGLRVLGDGGPINIPTGGQVGVASDGTIQVKIGEGFPAQIGRIKLVQADPSSLRKNDLGLFYVQGGEGASVDANIRVVSEALESSNVSVVEELTKSLSINRNFEMQTKLMQLSGDLAKQSARMLQMGG